MSYLKEFCCPYHPYVTLIENYEAGNMVCNFKFAIQSNFCSCRQNYKLLKTE